MILLDSSVLMDVIEAKPVWGEISARLLHESAQRHRLAINIVVLAEVCRSFADVDGFNAFLTDTAIDFIDIPREAGFLAAQAHHQYRQRGGQRGSTLPDFFIGAHASVARCPLLTRDPQRIRTYFPDVSLICPDNTP